MNLPLLSAHRGGPEDLYPANSFAAIEASLEIGADLIEFDVRTTADQKFVTYHDSAVMIDGSRVEICSLTAEAVLEAAPDAALVIDVLTLIKGRALGHVDLKDTRLEVEVADLCENVLGPDRFILTTLEDISVQRLRRSRPHLRVALSLGLDVSGMRRARALRIRLSEIFPRSRVRACDPTMLALNYKIARLGGLSWARRHNLDVLVWTINEQKVMKKTVNDERYWALTTDYPRRALALRASA